MQNFFSSAIEILHERIVRSCSGHGRDHETLEALLNAPGVLEAAVTHSIHDFVCTAVQGAMDEETRTASLMGHLASNMNWYALAAHWTAALCPGADDIRPCNLFWAQQARHIEAWRGADFGIAIRTGPETLRVALYQAKRRDPEGRVSLLRQVKDPAFANACLMDETWEPGGEATGYAASGRTRRELTALHQVHRLEDWRRRGIQILKAAQDVDVPDYSWCRYAFWQDVLYGPDTPGAGAPTERSGKDLFEAVRQGLSEGRGASSFDMTPNGTDLGLSICFHNEEDLVLSADQATEFLGRMQELGMPDFIAIDEVGGRGCDLSFWQKVFSSSHAVVTHIAGSGMAALTPTPNVDAPLPTPRPGRN